MAPFNQNDLLLNMQQLIDKSRCGIDGFFMDSKNAATDILKYLESRNLIIKNEQTREINYKERNRAA